MERVGAIYGGLEPKALPNQHVDILGKAKKVKKKLQPGLKVVNKVGGTARSIVSVIDGIKKVSSTIIKITKLSKVTSLLMTPFVALDAYEVGLKVLKRPEISIFVVKKQRLSKEEKQAIAREQKKNILERVRATAKFITHLDAIVDSVNTTCSLIYLFKPTLEKIIAWTPVYMIVSFFVGFISFLEGCETTWKGGKLVRDFKKVLTEVDDPHKSDAEKARILESFLSQFQEKDIKPLFKRLAISGKATTAKGMNVRNKIETLVRDRLRFSTKDVEDTTEILRTLAGRVSLQFGFDLTDTVNRIAGIVGKGFIIFAPPLAFVGFVIVATTGLVSLAMMGTRYFFVTANPFDPASETRARHIVSIIENAVGHLRERLRYIFSQPAKVPV